MGRHIYEHYTGEHVWKYIFGRQPSELYRIAEFLVDHNYEVEVYNPEIEEFIQYDTIGEVPDDFEIQGDSITLHLSEIHLLEEVLKEHDIDNLHREYAKILYRSGTVNLYEDGISSPLQEAMTEEEFIIKYSTKESVSYTYQDTEEMKTFVSEKDYDFLSMIHAFVRFANKPEHIKAAKEANEENPYFLIEAEIN